MGLKMAKRGRPIDPITADKTATVLARVSPDTRERLERAAEENGVSLSREIEARISSSFNPGAANEWGSKETYEFCVLVSHTLSTLRNVTGECWLNDPYTFEQAKQAIATVIDALRPPGRVSVPTTLVHLRTSALVGKEKAALKKSLLKASIGAQHAMNVITSLPQYAGQYGREARRNLEAELRNPLREAQLGAVVKMQEIGRKLLPRIGRVRGSVPDWLYQQRAGAAKRKQSDEK
jgi:hypothetical protein